MMESESNNGKTLKIVDKGFKYTQYCTTKAESFHGHL